MSNNEIYIYFMFIYIPYPHIKDVFFDALMDNMMDWNIDNKLCTIALNNYFTNDNVIELLRQKLYTVLLLMNGYMLYMCCYAHILNLIIQDGLIVITNGN